MEQKQNDDVLFEFGSYILFHSPFTSLRSENHELIR